MKIEHISTVLFAAAIVHTFLTPLFNRLAKKYSDGSMLENTYHLLGEVEVVFGIWAFIFFASFVALNSLSEAIAFIEGLSFIEPAFVFVIMVVAGTYPILKYAERFLFFVVQVIPQNLRSSGMYFLILSFGSLLGSLITEPAAMTLCALLLRDIFLQEKRSQHFLYITIAVLFVNISIGGTLTHFAAPPIVMVAQTWGWDLAYVFNNLGLKFLFPIILNAMAATYFARTELKRINLERAVVKQHLPFGVLLINLVCLFLVVYFAHHPILFIAILLFFLGIVNVTKEYHRELPLRQALLVGFFLAGLVVLGKMQAWWLQPLIASLSDLLLFISAAGLTAFTDNAALTYLGSLVTHMPDASKLALVAGAVAGGGLTVIANAPNPVGLAFISKAFGDEGVSALKLFIYALPATGLAMLGYWWLS